MYGAENANVLACNWVPVRPSYSEGQPREKRYHIAWLADSFKALIEKSMSICASSSPGRLPARLKSPNEAWSRYLIPDSLSQSDFAAEVIHPSWAWRWAPHAAWSCGGVVLARLLPLLHSHPAPLVLAITWSRHISKITPAVLRRRERFKMLWFEGIKKSPEVKQHRLNKNQTSSLMPRSCHTRVTVITSFHHWNHVHVSSQRQLWKSFYFSVFFSEDFRRTWLYSRTPLDWRWLEHKVLQLCSITKAHHL